MIGAHYFPMRRNFRALLERPKRGKEENLTLQSYGSPKHVTKDLKEKWL